MGELDIGSYPTYCKFTAPLHNEIGRQESIGALRTLVEGRTVFAAGA